MQLPMDDKYNYSKDYLVNRITILLGGRAAEEIVLQQQTTGAGDDLEKATEMARKMVCEWGMSDKLGPLTFGKNEEHIFLGREVARAKDYSEDTALADRQRDQAHRRRVPRAARGRSSRRTSRSSTRSPGPCSSASRSTAKRSRGSSAPGRSPRPPRRPEDLGRPGPRD